MKDIEPDFIVMIAAFLLFVITMISISINYPIVSLVFSLTYFTYVYYYFKNKN